MRADCATARARPTSTDDRRSTLVALAERIAHLVRRGPRTRAQLVAVSGIDGSGKSFLAEQIESALALRGVRTALIGIDPWQNARAQRIGARDPARTFYDHAIRWDALFETVVQPLVAQRGLDVIVEGRRTDNDLTYPKHYRFSAVEVVLLEGIFLLRRDFVHRYDLSAWVDCSFETALARALARNQEGLPPAEIEREYAEIYFPAQRLHAALDAPRDAAHVILPNDAETQTHV
jgi:uridine kinase